MATWVADWAVVFLTGHTALGGVKGKLMLTSLISLALTGVLGSCPTDAQAQPPLAAKEVSTPEVPADYVIGPEDVLGIVFWREPDISGDVTVRPDGRITVPVLGEMQAAGLSPEELQANILKTSAKYLNEPNVAVVVRSINSLKIYITGRVTTPGPHPLKGPLTAMQAIALAGGLTEYADAKNIMILRTANGRTQGFRFNYRDVAKGKALEQNIMLKPGDTVVVP